MFSQEAPPIPVEVFIGQKSGIYQIFVSRKFEPGGKLGLLNIINYEAMYDSEEENRYFIQSVLGYDLSKRFLIGAGARLTAFGFKPLIALNYGYFGPKVNLVLQPSYELHSEGAVSLFTVFEWRPEPDIKLLPYFRIQGLTGNNGGHTFSYHYWRVGVRVKNWRFGPAANFQYIGPDAEARSNFGGFLGVLIK